MTSEVLFSTQPEICWVLDSSALIEFKKLIPISQQWKKLKEANIMADDAQEEADSDDESAGCGLSPRSIRELPFYWADEDCETIKSLNLRLLGHPDYDVRVPLPSLPPSAQADPLGDQLWLILWCLQQGRDIAGFQLSWWSGEMDHIYPEDRRYTLGNIQLLSPGLNRSKGQLTQPEFADKLLRMEVITDEQHDEIVRQHEYRNQDPIGFLRWQLEQARKSLADSDSESA